MYVDSPFAIAITPNTPKATMKPPDTFDKNMARPMVVSLLMLTRE